MIELKRVLCVDDDDADQFLHRIRIGEFDERIEIRSVHSGEEALGVVLEGDYSPDLIFLDINMPGMNGFDFLEAYEAALDRTRPASPVIILSSSSWDSDGRTPEQFSSVHGHIRKPLESHWHDDVSRLLSASERD